MRTSPYPKATEAQRRMFNPGQQDNFTSNMEAKCSRLREGYRAGQRLFRSILSHRQPTVFDMLDAANPLSGDDKDGFMMGWQSDQYAYDNNMGLSVEGSDAFIPEDIYYGKIARETERDSDVFELSFVGQPEQE